MKSIILVALAIAAVAVAAPVDEPVKIIRSEFEQQPQGGYNFNFEAENGIQRQEVGEVKTVQDEENKPHDVVVVRGSYAYVNSDGKLETISYFADENGYRAEGDSIPKPARR